MQELKRLDVLSVGKIAGVTYGLLAVLFIPLFLIMAIAGVFSQDKEAAAISGVVGVIFAIAMPIVYGLMGFVFGCISAFIYNLVAGRIGGLKFELRPLSVPPVLPVPSSQNASLQNG